MQPRGTNRHWRFLRQNTIGDTGKDVGILEITSILREDLQLEGVEGFDPNELKAVENLIEGGFELLPSLQNTNQFSTLIGEEFAKRVDYDVFTEELFDIGVAKGTYDKIGIAVSDEDFHTYAII